MTTKKILTNPKEIFKEAISLIDGGKFELASKILKEALLKFPTEFSFINLLAQISLRNKLLDSGIALLRKSLEINKNQPLTLLDLGIALSLNNQLDEAIIFFDKSAELDSKNVNVYIRKASTLKKLNRLNEAIDCYQKIIDLSPNHIDAYINKAEMLYHSGKLKESLSFYQKASNIKPNKSELYIKCGVIFNKLGKVDEAISAYQKSIKINPENSRAYKNLGIIYKGLRRYDEACRYIKKFININQDYEALVNLAHAYCSVGNYKQGILYYTKGIKIQPKNPQAQFLKAYAQISNGDIDQAILTFDKVLKIDINSKYIFGDRFHAMNSICDWSNFEHNLTWLNLRIQEKKCVAVPLAICAFSDSPDTEMLGTTLFANDKFPLNDSLGPIKKYKKNKKIKIGYFSGDFSDHPVGFLIADLFERHDKSKFELYGFSVTKKNNSETRIRIKNSFDEFFDLENHSDKDIALLAREKKIDIAIDLGGYTKNSRPSIFSMRVAPIQINFLGYPGTTAATCIDYNIADKFIIPKKLQQYYSEKIIYLPKCYQPNQEKIIPSNKIFTRKSEGLPHSGFIFCCFNNTWKITPKMFELWIRLLSNVPGSVLWFPGFSDLAINNLRNECKKLSMDENRLIFSSVEEFRQDHYKKIRLADIFLDCFPYGAQSTASDFLRSGIPIVTLSGLSFSNRVASSLLNNLNLPELIATTEIDYENLALRLAMNPEFLNQIKTKLIANVKSSSIFNVDEYTKSIEDAYFKVYDRFHDNLLPQNIEAI